MAERERVRRRECRACGVAFEMPERGRPPVYCSPGCRQRAWAIREAERQLGTLDGTGPQVVRDLVERTVERVVPGEPRTPGRPQEWVTTLTALVDQLGDSHSMVSREHWHHQQLQRTLADALVALDHAHPGPLAQRRRR